MSADLKPCPLCHGHPIVLPSVHHHTLVHSVGCATCGAKTGRYLRHEWAAKAWNGLLWRGMVGMDSKLAGEHARCRTAYTDEVIDNVVARLDARIAKVESRMPNAGKRRKRDAK
jgi:hypothetical protein